MVKKESNKKRDPLPSQRQALSFFLWPSTIEWELWKKRKKGRIAYPSMSTFPFFFFFFFPSLLPSSPFWRGSDVAHEPSLPSCQRPLYIFFTRSFSSTHPPSVCVCVCLYGLSLSFSFLLSFFSVHYFFILSFSLFSPSDISGLGIAIPSPSWSGC